MLGEGVFDMRGHFIEDFPDDYVVLFEFKKPRCNKRGFLLDFSIVFLTKSGKKIQCILVR